MGLPATSHTRNQNTILEESPSSPSDIISIFSQHLIKLQSTSSQPKTTEVIPRLKTARYGEVLTTDEVLEKLKEANLKKIQKKTGTGKKRGRPIKKKYTDISDEFEDPTVQINEIQYDAVVWGSIKAGTFLLVNFLGGLRNMCVWWKAWMMMMVVW